MADRSVIVSALRTPFGKLGGGLARYEATQLGGLAIKSALERIGLEPHEPQYVIMGQVLQAGAGQAPARQAAIAAGLPKETPSDTINKVCASSIRAIEIADAMIRAGDVDVVVTGGMESMSNAPYLLKKARFGYRLGDGELIDSMVYDGLTSTFDQLHMVVQNSQVARELGISRETQDAWAARSQERAAAAQDAGRFDDEIIAVGDVTADEGVRRDTTVEKLAALPPVFDPDGTTTAGNAPGVNDGASCVIVCSEAWAAQRGRAAGDDPVAGVCRRRLRLSRPDAGERGRDGARSRGQDHRRRPARRDQRGVRLGRVELDEAPGRRRGDRQRERRRDRPRPPDRRLRRPHRLDDGA
jgi:acetyl-CoA C-acetyltransferase